MPGAVSFVNSQILTAYDHFLTRAEFYIICSKHGQFLPAEAAR